MRDLDLIVDLQAHWEREYPEVGPASAKLAVLEGSGFAPIGYFVLPDECWLDNYYRPMQGRFDSFLARHDNSAAARALVAAEAAEIDRYERHRTQIGYGYYLARKVGPSPQPAR